MEFRKEISGWLDKSFLSFFGFGIMTTVTSFQAGRKFSRRKHELWIFVRCSIMRFNEKRSTRFGVVFRHGAFSLEG